MRQRTLKTGVSFLLGLLLSFLFFLCWYLYIVLIHFAFVKFLFFSSFVALSQKVGILVKMRFGLLAENRDQRRSHILGEFCTE